MYLTDFGYQAKMDELEAQGKWKKLDCLEFDRYDKLGDEQIGRYKKVTVMCFAYQIPFSTKLTLARQQAIDTAFAKLDLTGSGFIHSFDIRANYNTQLHPLVVSGEITSDEAILKFLVNFSDENNDGTISKSEWDQYYSSVSAKVENEGHFIDLMNLVWKN